MQSVLGNSHLTTLCKKMRHSLMNGTWQEIAENLNKVTARNIQFTHKEAVFGGDINQAWKVSDSDNKNWFIKTNHPSLLPMFKAEALGLDEIEKSKSIRTPKSYCYGATDELSYLILEFIELSPLINQSQAGEQLALMHQCHSSNTFKPDKAQPFGWPINNTIGSTPQSNKTHETWESFYKHERLSFQLELAKSNNYPTQSYENGQLLIENLHYFFARYTPKPSLLHGDLWAGNCACDDKGHVVIFDPAVYFGDRETDLAMTELFGGFNADFYSAYNNYHPLDQDYKTRKNLYNLYHILNHFNLFGGSYASQADNMIKKLLSEL